MHLSMIVRPKIPVRRPRRPPPKLYVGPWLRKLGLDQVTVAKAVGIGESHMSLIVSGHRYPSHGTLTAIAAAMDITEQELRAPPPTDDLVRAAAAISPGTLAKLSRNIRKTDH